MMEESSNGKTEEPHQVEPEENVFAVNHVEETKAEVINHEKETKAQVESVREIVIDENPESHDRIDPISDTSNDTPEEEGEGKEENCSIKNEPEVFQKEEKEVSEPIIDSVEPILSFLLPEEVEKSKDPEVESTEIDENNVTEIGSVSEEGDLSGTKETVSEAVSTATEETKLPCDDKDNFSASLEENASKAEIDDVAVEKSGEPSAIFIKDKEYVGNVDHSFKQSTNATIVGSNDASPQTPTNNPHDISLSKRTIRPTSWRSCCGLFDVLRRS